MNILSLILTPFAKLLLLLYDLTGSYGLALILFAFVIRLILFPIFLRGRKSMLSMSGLTEKQKILQQKYARDRERYSQELQKLYDQEGVKPSGGCLWSLLPMPFLMALYAIIRQPLTHLMSMTSDQIQSVYQLLYNTAMSSEGTRNEQLQMAQDVFLNYDRIVAAIPELSGMPKIDFSFFGVNLSDVPSFLFWRAEDVGAAFGLWLIPVISAVLSVLSMIVTNKINAHILQTERVMDQSARTTMMVMPLFSLWICFTLPAALGVYWIANSLAAIVQELANMPFLKKYMDQLAVEREKRQAEEKERVVREKKAQAEAKKKAQEEMRRIQMERKLNKSVATASREGLRAYARGRLYDPERYPSFPYQDPNEIYAQEQARKSLEEAQQAADGKKRKKDSSVLPPPPEQAPVTPAEELPLQEAPEGIPQESPAEPSPDLEAPDAGEPEIQEDFVEESFLEEPEADQE